MSLKKLLLLSSLSHFIYAESIFNFTVINDTTGEKFSRTTHSTTEIADILDRDISSQFASTKDLLHAQIDYRGLPMVLNIFNDSQQLKFNIPSLKIEKIFSEGNREDNLKELERWFENEADVGAIMKKLAEVSPVDPIAGNPNSRMATSVKSNFKNGFQNVASSQKSSASSDLFIASPSFSNLNIDGINSRVFTLPLAYSLAMGYNPKERLSFSFPLSYGIVNGAKSFMGSFGLAYSVPITNNWILTPSGEYSGVISSDFGSIGESLSTSLTSSYKIDLGSKYAISFGNMIGYYSTVDFFASFNPEIANTVFRNAIMYSLPTDEVVMNTSLDMFIIDTRYVGSKLYLNSYNEIGLSFGLNSTGVSTLIGDKNQAYGRELKIGVTYLTSSKIKGFSLNFGYAF